jgi:hypothetical protein
MSREEIREKQLYYTIVAGSFRVQVPQDSPDAVRRDWKSADGTKSGTKYERVVNALFGFISDIQFRDGDFGMQMFVTLDENEDGEKPVIALATQSRECEDLMKKLPNINLSKEVRLRPFNFEGSEGDEVRGMEVMQQDEEEKFKVKITNFFRDVEKKVNINGYPNPDGETEEYSKDDWKIYFLSARKFLINYTKEKIAPKLMQTQDQKDDEQFAASKHTPDIVKKQRNAQEVAEGIDVNEVPF